MRRLHATRLLAPKHRLNRIRLTLKHDSGERTASGASPAYRVSPAKMAETERTDSPASTGPRVRTVVTVVTDVMARTGDRDSMGRPVSRETRARVAREARPDRQSYDPSSA